LSAVPAFQHVRIDRDFKCKATVLASGAGIRQLLTNLLVNAMESGAKTIRIRVAHGRDWRRPGLRGVRISIADDGHGIIRENLKHLFQPFFSTKGTRGTGLGLWSSRAIVLKIDGSIKLRSVAVGLRTGTCVSLFLPTVAIANSLDSLRSEQSHYWSASQMDIGHRQEPFGSRSNAARS
jgi:signal transduction histidine kinase